MNLNNLISYYQECYSLDNRQQEIFDFLGTKVESSISIKNKEELITGEYPLIPIDFKKGEVLYKKHKLFEKEKSLIYGSFFIAGNYKDFKGQIKRLFAPLVYYPAGIEKNGEDYYLRINAEERKFNIPLFNMLSDDSFEDLLKDKSFSNIESNFIRFEDVRNIGELIENYLPSIQFDNLLNYPSLENKSKVLSFFKTSDAKDVDHHELILHSMVGLVESSSNTRGVVNELKELSNQSLFSAPINYVFDSNLNTFSTRELEQIDLPMVLSQPQKTLVNSSLSNVATTIVGPPGTGKTYTICAIALAHLFKGESVLIASKTNEAVDVIADKLKDIVDGDQYFVRTGKKRIYTTPLRRFLKALLTKNDVQRYLARFFNVDLGHRALGKDISDLKIILKKINKSNFKQKELFDKYLLKEEKIAAKLLINSSEFSKFFLKLRAAFRFNKIDDIVGRVYRDDIKKIRLVKTLIKLKYINSINSFVLDHWSELNQFNQALKLKSDTERILKFNNIDFAKILKAFPIWMTNLSEINESIPFMKELFDVVIIDEATQCDIASVLPLIQRGKRLVIAGDPNQLRHVSFLSKYLQNDLAHKFKLTNLDRFKLNYRDNSILDLVIHSLQSKTQIAILNEHFRGDQKLIGFSNHEFYDNELIVMKPSLTNVFDSLKIIRCKGVREANGTNPIEAYKLIDLVKKYIDDEKNGGNSFVKTIGILSPFRDQVDFLSKLVYTSFTSEDIDDYQIRVGTPYSFQGEERDVMFLSMVVDSHTHHSAFIHINKNAVFNVAITRARQKQYVLVSVDSSDLNQNTLLYGYLNYINKDFKPSLEVIERGVESVFLSSVFDHIESLGVCKVTYCCKLGFLTIPILFEYKNSIYGIDFIGYDKLGLKNESTIDSYRIIMRAGVKMIPVSFVDWTFNKEQTLIKISSFLNN